MGKMEARKEGICVHPFFICGGVSIPAYGAMVALGVAVALGLFFPRVGKGRRLRAAGIVGVAALGALLGAKGLYLLTMPEGLAFREMLLSGFVFYGGLIGGVAGGYFAARRMKESFVELMDAAAPCIAVGHGIGRVGCFLAGCCYGRPMAPPLGLLMPQALGAPHDVALFPVQLLEAALNISLGIFLLIYSRRRREEGQVTGLYLVAYAGIRFCVEFLRYDAVRGFAGALSTGQWMSILAWHAGLLLFARVSVIDIGLNGARAAISARLFGGLLPIKAEAGLYRDLAGKLSFQVKVRNKPVKVNLTRRAEVDIEDELRALLGLLRVRRLRLYAVVGVGGDAALTAKLCGLVQAALGTLCALTRNREGEMDKKCDVRPDYQHDAFHFAGNCIIFFRTGKVMRVGCKVLLKIAKGAYQKWRTRLKTSCVPPWKT